MVCLGWLVLGVPSANATLLNLMAEGPDVTSGVLDVQYQASSGSFTVAGTAMTFDLDHISPPDYNITSGNYAINMLLTPAGIPTSGSLSIMGKIPALGANSGTLLTGQISQFGFQNPPGGEIFEFIFNVNGGDLASYYAGKAGVILNASDTGFTGSFTSNFSNSPFSASTDTFPVPEPSTAILLFILGAAVLTITGWRRTS
jgi:hypothetical protein